MFASEFRHNKVLQWALGALIFSYFIVFYSWVGESLITQKALQTFDFACPAYFQSCGNYYVLQALPEGYSQTILYMVFFGILIWCVYLITQKAWEAVQLCLVPVFLWHSAVTLILSDYRSGNYEYYLMAFGCVLLFLPHKEFFLKLTIVVFYVLSTVAKIHPSWIEGGYFTALRTGLPLFPYWSIPLWTNIAILFEMVGSWFLMSRNLIIQRTVLIFFIAFHLYSGILVEYRYPATILPMLLIAFGPWYRYTYVPLTKRAVFGWAFIFLLFFLQFTPKFIPGDEKLTLEGNKYGLYMFEANHQCFSQAKVHLENGEVVERNDFNTSARNRCEPYHYWFQLKEICKRARDVVAIEWKLNHSINAGPFYQIVDTANVCELEYHPFRHNEWIGDENSSEIIGYPVKNVYR